MFGTTSWLHLPPLLLVVFWRILIFILCWLFFFSACHMGIVGISVYASAISWWSKVGSPGSTCSFLYFIMLYQHLLHLLVTNDLQSLFARRLRLLLLPLPRVNNKRSLPPALLLIPPLPSCCPQCPSCHASRPSGQRKSLDTSSGCYCWGDCEQRKGPCTSLRVKNISHSSRGLTVKCFRQGFLHCSPWN